MLIMLLLLVPYYSKGANAIGAASLTGSRYTSDYAIAGAGPTILRGYAATGVGSLCAAFGSGSLAGEYETGTEAADGYAL